MRRKSQLILTTQRDVRATFDCFKLLSILYSSSPNAHNLESLAVSQIRLFKSLREGHRLFRSLVRPELQLMVVVVPLRSGNIIFETSWLWLQCTVEMSVRSGKRLWWVRYDLLLLL